MRDVADFTRRTMLVMSLASASFAAVEAQTVWPPGRRLAFEVWRGKQNIGHHVLQFSGSDQSFVVAIDALITISLGPLPIFKYHHQATETWRGGQFAELQSHSVTNGKTDQVSAVHALGGVVIKTPAGIRTIEKAALPLTHWNQQALQGPLFNPQTGAMMHESVSRHDGQMLQLANATSIAATRYTLSGEADVTDWYDAGGVWTALRAKAPDGSSIDYRRSV